MAVAAVSARPISRDARPAAAGHLRAPPAGCAPATAAAAASGRLRSARRRCEYDRDQRDRRDGGALRRGDARAAGDGPGGRAGRGRSRGSAPMAFSPDGTTLAAAATPAVGPAASPPRRADAATTARAARRLAEGQAGAGRRPRLQRRRLPARGHHRLPATGVRRRRRSDRRGHPARSAAGVRHLPTAAADHPDPARGRPGRPAEPGRTDRVRRATPSPRTTWRPGVHWSRTRTSEAGCTSTSTRRAPAWWRWGTPRTSTTTTWSSWTPAPVAIRELPVRADGHQPTERGVVAGRRPRRGFRRRRLGRGVGRLDRRGRAHHLHRQRGHLRSRFQGAQTGAPAVHRRRQPRDPAWDLQGEASFLQRVEVAGERQVPTGFIVPTPDGRGFSYEGSRPSGRKSVTFLNGDRSELGDHHQPSGPASGSGPAAGVLTASVS